MYIRAKDINSAWKRILSTIWSLDSDVISERGKTKEILNLMVTVRGPYDEEIEGFSMNPKALLEYAGQLMDPERGGFEYTYGERLRDWGSALFEEGTDQIAGIVDRLKTSHNSRRATAATWIPPLDHKNSEVPCMILLDVKVREGKSHMTAVFRSNDMFGAWPANVYGLNKVNEYISREIGVENGSVTTLSISAHVYEHDWENLKKVLEIS